MQELTDKINEEINNFLRGAEYRLQGNKAAGARARKASLALTKLFKEYRKLSVKN